MKREVVGNLIDITSRLPKAKDVRMMIDKIIEIAGALNADPNDRFSICGELIKEEATK